jgi:hypothetical protein
MLKEDRMQERLKSHSNESKPHIAVFSTRPSDPREILRVEYGEVVITGKENFSELPESVLIKIELGCSVEHYA